MGNRRTSNKLVDTMSKYARIEDIKHALYRKGFCIGKTFDEFYEALSEVPTIDIAHCIVHCGECKWYEKPHIRYNNGKKKYFDSEAEIEYVTADIGMNVGGRCVGHKTYCTAHDRLNPDDYAELVIFRRTDDFCSYGERSKE